MKRRGAGLIRLAALLFWCLCGPGFAEPLRIAVISDLNGSYGSADYGNAVSGAVADIIARRPDLVITTGDMVAGQRARPKLANADLARMWASFHTVVSDPLAKAGIPLLVTPGNHDASAYPGFETERLAFFDAWADRKPDLTLVDSAHWPFRVAASLQGVLFVGMDATRAGPLAEADLTWLSGVLATQGPGHRRIVLFGHVPLMPITQGRETEVLADPALFDLARTSGVGLWLSGHHHGFYSGTAGGMLFVAQGCLGSGPRKVLGTAAASDKSYTWIEIADDGAISVTAHAAPDFTAPAVPGDLPETLGTGPFRLTLATAVPR